MTPPLSTKTGGGEGRRGNEEIRVRRGERWGRRGRWTWREEKRRVIARVCGKRRRGKRKNDGRGEEAGTKRAVDLSSPLDARIAALKQYTGYTRGPSTKCKPASLYVVDDRENGRRYEGGEKRAKILVSSLLLNKLRKKERNESETNRRIFFLFNNGGKRLEEKFPW